MGNRYVSNTHRKITTLLTATFKTNKHTYTHTHKEHSGKKKEQAKHQQNTTPPPPCPLQPHICISDVSRVIFGNILVEDTYVSCNK